jgi:hypothetical protein
VELVSGSVRASQAEPFELQDAFEVREEHLDLLPLPPRCDVFLGDGEVPCHVASTFVG